jgi:hypothetical protein
MKRGRKEDWENTITVIKRHKISRPQAKALHLINRSDFGYRKREI